MITRILKIIKIIQNFNNNKNNKKNKKIFNKKLKKKKILIIRIEVQFGNISNLLIMKKIKFNAQLMNRNANKFTNLILTLQS